jgi:sugar fermentation stimulation protein A
MQFEQRLQKGKLIRRYKRFLADVELADGSIITIHCPNSGSMLGCKEPGSPVLFSRSDNPQRKYPNTFEMVQVGGVWVGINTSLTNKLVREAIELGRIKEFGKVDTIQPEVKVSDKSRLDLLLTKGDKKIYIEVKNCTMVENSVAMFPDAVTTRGAKHLRELLELKQAGHGAVIFFCVQRMDADRFAPARHIDPTYGKILKEVCGQGVMPLVYQWDVQPEGIELFRQLPVVI